MCVCVFFRVFGVYGFVWLIGAMGFMEVIRPQGLKGLRLRKQKTHATCRKQAPNPKPEALNPKP